MKENTKEGFELTIDVSIEELEAKIAPEDNGETVLPLPKEARSLGVNPVTSEITAGSAATFPGAEPAAFVFFPPR